MDNNYRILGLEPGADAEKVQEAYRKLAIQYNPDKFTDINQKKWAQQQMEEINHAFDEIMNSLRTGKVSSNSDRDEFYIYIRRLIQTGDYRTAMDKLNSYPNTGEAEWQFLMGSALYYNGYISQSFDHFRLAAEMNPSNREYTATYNRMNRSRNGNIYSSPYSQEQTFQTGVLCCDPCTLCQCLICMDCCCNH